MDALCSSPGEDEEENHSIQEAKQRISAFAHKQLTAVAIELNVPAGYIEAVTPCTPLQEGMIYRKSQTGKPVYLSNFGFELEPNVEILRLKFAWRKAQAHLQLLRTKFVATDDGHALVVLKKDILPWFEITSVNDDEVETAAAGRHREWCEATVDFTGRLWEINIVSGPTRKWMCLNMFHALYDGNSLPLLLGLVAQVYAGVEPPESPRYTDILPQGPLRRIPGAKSFWIEHLKPSSQTKLPRMENMAMAESVVAILDMEKSDFLEPVRRKLNVTSQAVVHACWIYSFVRCFKFAPTFGIVKSGRALEIQDTEKIVGPMFNTIPCYIPLTGASCLADLAVSCHDYHISSIPYQHTALRDIMKWSKRNVDQPLFDSLFTFQKSSEDSSPIAESLWKMKDSSMVADYPLAFEAEYERTGSLRITIVAQGDVLTPEMAQRLAERFSHTIFEFSKNPYAELSLLDNARASNGEETIINDRKGGAETPRGRMVNGTFTFEWTNIATRIRQEIATLAGIEAHEICEGTSVLEVGLDSIDAVKLSSRLRKAGIKLPVSVIMSARTIQAMTARVGSDSNDNETAYDSHLETELRECLEKEGHDLSTYEHILPATPLQEGMLAEMVASDYRRYFNHDVLEIGGSVDVNKLGEAWAAAVRAHPILRTSFAHISDPKLPFSYAQLVHDKNEPVRWDVEHTGEKTLETIIEEERIHALNADLQYPPLSLKVLRAEGKRLLVVSISHALYDGWSLDLLHQDVMSFYAGHVCSRPSYHKLIDHVVRDFRERSLQFWKNSLDRVPLALFPKQAAASGSQEGLYRQERTVSVSSSKIISFCKKQGITGQCLGVTCWSLVLASYLGVLDVIFGTVLSGRDVENAEQMMFPTMNTAAIRAIIHGTHSELLKHMQGILANILDHQHFPLRKAKSLAGGGGQDLFDTLFIFQKRPEGHGTHLEPLYKSVHSSSEVEFPVCAEMEFLEGTVVWRLACRDTHLGEKDTSILLDRIEYVLNDIVEHPDGPTIQYGNGGVFALNAAVCPQPAKEQDSAVTENAASLDDGWTPAELKMRSVISIVADVPATNITKQTTLFHLGLDSISAIKVSSLLKKESISLAVSDLLKAGTVPKMAEAARSRQPDPMVNSSNLHKPKLLRDVQTKQWLLTHNISLDDVENVMPTTSGQVYMLEMWHNSKGQLFYPYFFYQVKGDITPEKLERSWDTLTRQLPILRTAFLRLTQDEMCYAQVVMKAVKNPIVWRTDLSRNYLDRRLIQRRPDSIPVALYASYASSMETTLMLHLHHSLYDAVSLSRIISLLSALCNDIDVQEAGQAGMPDLLAFNSVNSPVENRKAFWQAYMDGVRQPDGEVSGDPGENCCIVSNYRPSLVKEISALETASRTYGVTVQALFLAIYANIHISLSLGAKYSDATSTEHVVVGVYLANRSHSFDGLPEMAAPTLNIVPLYMRDPVQRSILDLARQVQGDLLEIGRAQNSCVSLAEVSDWTGIKLDTFVNFMKYPESDLVGTADDVGVDRRIEIVPLEEGRLAESTSDNDDGYCAPFSREGSPVIENQSSTEKPEPGVVTAPENAGEVDYRRVFKVSYLNLILNWS